TGFKTLTTNEREAYVLITKNNAYLFTDSRYFQDSSVLDNSGVKLKLLEPGKGLIFYLQEIFNLEHIISLGYESEDLKVNEYMVMQKIFTNIQLIPLEKTIIKIREKKDLNEIEKISKACVLSDQCLKELIPFFKVGISEKEIAFKIEFWFKSHNSDIAFDPIVAVNKNSAIPHYNTKSGNGMIEESSIILIDFGSKYQDYLSDITRMVFINPNSEMQSVYNQLLTIQEDAMKYISLDKTPVEVDSFCRNELQKKYLPSFSHSLGHGVGLEIHEFPKISQTSLDLVLENQVFTIEPGVYFENKWGIRIEDTVVVQNGKAETLTKFDKKICILDL
ncbi:MAG: M24 family metallopeptidase, partial [bacterium]|nr:M24 family metallopeptidase [bacterium]